MSNCLSPRVHHSSPGHPFYREWQELFASWKAVTGTVRLRYGYDITTIRGGYEFAATHYNTLRGIKKINMSIILCSSLVVASYRSCIVVVTRA